MVLRIVAGSHLSGFATPSSDYDFFEVRDYVNGKNHHSIDNGVDVTTASFDAWFRQAQQGSHQALDAMFADDRFVIERDYDSIRKGWVCGTDVYDTFDGFIKRNAIRASETNVADRKVKSRRLVYLSVLKLNQIVRNGRYNPTATPEQVRVFFEDYAPVSDNVFEDRLRSLSILSLSPFDKSL